MCLCRTGITSGRGMGQWRSRGIVRAWGLWRCAVFAERQYAETSGLHCFGHTMPLGSSYLQCRFLFS